MNRKIRVAFCKSTNPVIQRDVPERLHTMSGFLGHLVIPSMYSGFMPTCSFVEYPRTENNVNRIVSLFMGDTLEVKKAEDAFHATSLDSPILRKVILGDEYWYVGHGIILDDKRRLLYLVTRNIEVYSDIRIFISSYIFYRKKDKLCKYIITQVLSDFCTTQSMHGCTFDYSIENLDSFVVVPRRPEFVDDFDKSMHNFLVQHVDHIMESLCNFVTFEENS